MSNPPMSPDARKKNPALPSLLSNLRNAQAVIGRAADDLHEREIRPLVGGGGGSRMSASVNNPQLHRGPSSSLSSTLQNFSQRFGSQWRKRSGRRKKGHGVTIVPQSFFIAVGCFFVAFPVIFIVFVLARHAVFGDEGDTSGSQAHIHEVPSAFSNGGKELLGRNKIDPPAVEIEGSGEIGEKKSSSNQGLEVYAQMVGEGDPSPLIETATNDLRPEVKSDNMADQTIDQTIGDIEDKSESTNDSITKAKNDASAKEDSAENMHHMAEEGVESTFTNEEATSSTFVKDIDVDTSEHAIKASSGDSRKEHEKSNPSSDQVVVKEDGENLEKEARTKNLRASQNEDE